MILCLGLWLENGVLFVYIERTVFVHNKILFGLLFFFFSYFLHQHTLPVTMKLGTVLVNTFGQVLRKVYLVLHGHDTAVERLQCQRG